MRRGLLAVAVVIALCGVGLALAGSAAGTHEQPDRTVFAVLLEADGDAEVVSVTSYDLGDDEEREAYESLRDDGTEQADRRDAFVAEIEEQAARSAEATGREMRVHGAEVRTYEDETEEGDEYGRFEIRVRWDGLAAVDGESVVVTEPFAGGYEPDRRIAVHGPDGYVRDAVRPEPEFAGRDSGMWNPEAVDLEGFEARFVAEGQVGTPEDPGWSGSRTFLGAAALALIPVLVVLAAHRRRRTGTADTETEE